ncbi:MAG: ribonuclease P protein component [Planctomycetota bacterium]
MSAATSPDESFPAECRIRSGNDFRRAYQLRKSVADDTLIVYGHFNDAGVPRLGLSVSRKVGNAVVRNQWKRRIREAFRLHRTELPTGVDFVVIPRKGALPDWDAIVQSFPRLAERVARKLERNDKRANSNRSRSK